MLHRVHRKLQGKGKKEPIDYFVRFFMIATPLFELPQAYIIYSTQSAAGVSFFTWAFFAMSSLVWLTYGFRARIFPLAVAYSLYLTIEISIVIGILMYS